MRMRRKKNLEQRLSDCGDYIIIRESEDKNFVTAAAQKKYLPIDAIFPKRQPLYLEIGCGKGGFACEFAEKNPDINLLAVEKNSNVLVTAAENAIDRKIENLRFLKCSAEYLPAYLMPKSVSRIFLNFSCPFPKTKYTSHRLTAPAFLRIYRKLLQSGCAVHQKTDNIHFFEFSIEQFSREDYIIQNISLDLHNSGFEGNIMTEYESRFAKQGSPIYRLEATPR